jgi:hypothetical protein
MWRRTHCARRGGRSRRSPGIWVWTARRARITGVRSRTVPDVIAPFVEYCRIRLADDPHLWASTLFDELQQIGFGGAYSCVTAAIRVHGSRPHCESCQAIRGRDVAIIAHPPGDETQWDWWSYLIRRRRGTTAGRRICGSGRWRIQVGGWRARSSGRTSRIWSRPSTGWCAGWVGSRGGGGPGRHV